MNKQQIESILNSAPEGASHWDGEDYYDLDKFSVWQDGEWVGVPWHFSGVGIRSIADLRQILSLMERVAEIEKEKSAMIEQHDMWKQQWHELNSSLQKRDLEQQAKGVIDYANSQEDGMTAVWAIAYAEKLKQKAEQMK